MSAIGFLFDDPANGLDATPAPLDPDANEAVDKAVEKTTTDTATGTSLLEQGMKKLASALNLTAPNSKPVNQDDYPVFDPTKFVMDAWGQVKGELGKAQAELDKVLHGAQGATA